mgnify:CR=1 FL=1
MLKKIRIITYITILILIIFGLFNFLNDNGFKFGGKKFIDFLISKFDYINIVDDNTANVQKDIFKVKNITNYEYRNIYYNKKEVKKEDIPVSSIKKEPIVYIYNTHQSEKYPLNNSEPYNIIPTVMTTSYMLKEKLSEYNIESIVEESSVNEVLKKNNWKYASSYKVTRTFLEKAKKEYPSLKFYIDVHRDSVKRSITTKEINNVSYARVMFILGLENENYEKNSKVIEYLNNEIEKKYPGLSRGIYKKKGPGVNGVYNQDFSENCILIEFGGSYNTIDEVYNTVEAIGQILGKYIGDLDES